MKIKSSTHTYLLPINVGHGTLDKDTSERYHLEQINERFTKISREIFAKTPAEKAATKEAINSYVNKNHKPLSVVILHED